MVEFALVAPIFLFLLLVLLDFGRGLFYYSEMSAGAREADRQAVLLANASSNLGPGPGCSSPCRVPGVLPQVQQVASFGYPVVYADSSAHDQVPAYAQSYTASPDPTQPGTIQLAASASPNTVYVFVYQLGSDGSSAPYWACSCDAVARTGGHRSVVVDLEMKFQPVSLAFAGLGPVLTFDSRTVEREEWYSS